MIARGTAHIIFIPMITGIAISIFSIYYTTSYIPYIIGNLIVLVSLLLLIFFRDPVRSIGPGVVAPADGKVLEVDARAGKVSIFMGVQNVHVNRSPVAGLVLGVKHIRGSHLPAFRKDSERNERVVIRLGTGLGDVKVVQIAGILARRIVPYVRPGVTLKKGQRIGIIRLGSRVDVHLPRTVRIVAEVGDKVKAGTSQIGALRNEADGAGKEL